MVEAGKHHNSALCHVASTLLTRIVACWRAGEPYVIRDTEGTAVSVAEGRRIVAERYTVPAELRAQRRLVQSPARAVHLLPPPRLAVPAFRGSP